MFRYFCSNESIAANEVTLVGPDVKHLRTILRAKIGDELSVITDEAEYLCHITQINKDDIICQIQNEVKKNNESNINITLCQGLPKQAKMETIIQQNVEVGVKCFIPLVTERTIVKLNDKDRETKKIERWQKIAKESSKQSKRHIVPKVEDLTTINDLVKRIKDEGAEIIVPYELEDVKTLNEVLKEPKGNYYIIIGPEGGFDISEINMFQTIGAHIVTLGPRIMRTETAGVVTAAVIMYACGEMSQK